MALSDVIASRAKSAVVGGIQSGLVNVAGNLLGVGLSNAKTLGPQAPLHEKSEKRLGDVDILSYPLNVGADPQQGHYIMFNINVQDKGKMGAAVRAQTTTNDVRQSLAQSQGGIAHGQALTNFSEQLENLQVDSGANLVAADVQPASRGHSSALQVSNPSTTRITTCIALYMPPSVQTSYAANYNDQKIGVLAEVGKGVIDRFKQGSSTLEMVQKTLADRNLDVGLKQAILASLDTVAPGAKALFALERGKIITPRMELMFDGIGRRNFSFAFVFIPKSEQEAKEIEKIIYQFKYHMAADFSDEVTQVSKAGQAPIGPGVRTRTVREMDIPSTFDIEYKYLHGTNNFLNKISTCVLSKLDVEYGSDRFIAHKESDGRLGPGAPPQTTKLTLAFTELELITKTRIKEGY